MIVLDGVGIGELPDAARFGDQGSNTLVNTALAVGGLNLPFMQELGLGNLASIPGVRPIKTPVGRYGVMQEASAGRDTLTGHWEIAGLIVHDPFPIFSEGFPLDLIRDFERSIGRRTLGNKAGSGTVIIEELGEEHLISGYPIIYTAADSVFQIAAHKDVVQLDDLYEYCRAARQLLRGEFGLGRVIARPFIGRPGSFVRTVERRDFCLPPPAQTMLERVAASGKRVWGIGKIEDLFSGQGLTDPIHTGNNRETMALLRELAQEESFEGLVFANCIDFDTLYGHRNDPGGFAAALCEVDRDLSTLFGLLDHGDLLLVTADHGCDPTTPGTNHSREHVPLLVAGWGVKPGALGVRRSFADAGSTVEELLVGTSAGPGTSFAVELFD